MADETKAKQATIDQKAVDANNKEVVAERKVRIPFIKSTENFCVGGKWYSVKQGDRNVEIDEAAFQALADAGKL